MVAVLAVADGADGDNDLYVRPTAAQHFYRTTQVVSTFLYRQFTLVKEGCRTFLTVIDYLTRRLFYIHVVGTQRQEGKAGSRLATLYRMQHAGRVIHGAVGIDRRGELLFLKPPANAVSKA